MLCQPYLKDSVNFAQTTPTARFEWRVFRCVMQAKAQAQAGTWWCCNVVYMVSSTEFKEIQCGGVGLACNTIRSSVANGLGKLVGAKNARIG